MFRILIACVCVILFTQSSFSIAQDAGAVIDKSKIPAAASDVKNFVPPGWKIEERLTGDLNGDGVVDYALKLVEDKPAKKDDVLNERRRSLVIIFGSKDGKLSRAAVADKLLQCTACGGAFYGVVEAPANVKIEKGTLIIEQDHGSREVTELAYRFRYEPAAKRFALIGFDIRSRDRANGDAATESTNYLTGVRITTRGKGKRNTTSRKNISKEKIYIEQVDNEKFEEAAGKRLGL